MITTRYIKSYKSIISLAILVAITPLLGIPSWMRDLLTYILGISIAIGVYLLNRQPKEVSTIKESLDEAPIENIIEEVKSDFSSLNQE